ncbi:MAG: GTP-binding protein [Patescibacteria group bacterium]|nr:GTP-binding protein [Patescibacteria group bacterium]MCL5224415.1 GTP-binding protein [Patescibacteria group bacterium]
MSGTESLSLKPRPPVVVIVGHVDHGKTSLLDYLRKTNVVAREAGGITQSVGAYEVVHNSKKITFIDTPGHEAFSMMRQRGANIADLAVLVVASDEGVKPQTVEAIKILNDTETPFVVAITKIDKPNANIDKVKNELLANSVLLEGFGGNVSWQPISVISGEGINELLDLILLMGDVSDLSYDPDTNATGYVLESLKDNRRGVVVHVILKNGVLREGEEIATPSAKGKIRILEDFKRKKVKELLPSAPAAIVGFESLPNGGEMFTAGLNVGNLTKDNRTAIDSAKPVSEDGSDTKLKVAIKADTSGSLEALRGVLNSKLQITSSAVGNITDGDVKSAITTGSVIIGFNVKVDKATENLAQAQHVEIVTSDIIYRLTEAIEARLKAMQMEKPTAGLNILKVFGASGRRQIVGGKVTVGVLKGGMTAKINRAGSVLGDGRILNVQIGKKDVAEASEGVECGLLFESDVPVRAGDDIQVF